MSEDQNNHTERVVASSSGTTTAAPPPPPACTGRAAAALAEYRAREAALRAEGRRKPDMVAFKELRDQWLPPEHRAHGELPGVPAGLRLQGRGEAAILGLHTKILSGIDARPGESCYAVCASGGYGDDDDHRSDGSIVYTGSGGRQHGKRQVVDQEENIDNVSLMRSWRSGLPIRVLRGRKEDGRVVYVYDGLYVCTDYTYEPSRDGPKVYRFVLVPAEGNTKPKAFAVDSAAAGDGTSSVKGGPRIRLEHKMKQQLKKRKSAKTSRGRLMKVINNKKRR